MENHVKEIISALGFSDTLGIYKCTEFRIYLAIAVAKSDPGDKGLSITIYVKDICVHINGISRFEGWFPKPKVANILVLSFVVRTGFSKISTSCLPHKVPPF